MGFARTSAALSVDFDWDPVVVGCREHSYLSFATAGSDCQQLSHLFAEKIYYELGGQCQFPLRCGSAHVSFQLDYMGICGTLADVF